jgi:aryl-alcohol dehydrogenase-like predicted oxidoreductase
MDLRPLGNSDLRLTPIGFGAWAIGGEWRFGWGPQDDADSSRAIARAIDHGVNWIDTAPAYGLGHSEEVVGKVVATMPPDRRPYVFTKCSLVWDEEERVVTHSLQPASIRREVEQSLRRLGVGAIDLDQIHWPRWHTVQDGVDPGRYEDAWRTLETLRREGKVRWIGVSNFSAEELAVVHAIAPVTSVQPPYSLIRRDVEQTVLPWCAAHGVGAIVYSPMQSGLLSGRMTRERVAALPAGDWRRDHANYQEPLLTRNLAIAEALADVAARHGRSAGEAAIAWTLRLPAVTGAIVGARTAAQVDGIIGAGTFRLSPAEIAEIEARTNEARAVTPA